MKKIIGICGGSGSGKTTLSNQLVSHFNNEVAFLSLDDYYKPIAEQFVDINGKINFDLPSGLNLDQFFEHLQILKSGKNIQFEEYVFNNPNALPTLKTIEPKEIVLVEGIFLLADKRIVSILDTIIFLETDIDTMFNRRKSRDIDERGISEEMISYQWHNHFLPAYHQFVEPNKNLAHHIFESSMPIDIKEIENLIK